MTTQKIIEGIKDRRLFVRFKDIPAGEVSGVYDGDCGRIRDELGVSCYDFVRRGNNYNIILSSISEGFLYDLCHFVRLFNDGKIPGYLIEAEQVGNGTYGEPVVKNVRIMCQLKTVELAYPKPTYKMDMTNPQLRTS